MEIARHYYEFQPPKEFRDMPRHEAVVSEAFPLFSPYPVPHGRAGPIEMFKTTFSLELPTAEQISFNARAEFLHNGEGYGLFPDIEDCPLDLSVTSHVRYRLQRGEQPDLFRDPGCTFRAEDRSTFEQLRLQLSLDENFAGYVLEADPHPTWLDEGQLHFEHFSPEGQLAKAKPLVVPSNQNLLSGIYARFTIGRAPVEIPPGILELLT